MVMKKKTSYCCRIPCLHISVSLSPGSGRYTALDALWIRKGHAIDLLKKDLPAWDRTHIREMLKCFFSWQPKTPLCPEAYQEVTACVQLKSQHI